MRLTKQTPRMPFRGHRRNTRIAYTLISTGIVGLSFAWLVYDHQPIAPEAKSIDLDSVPSSVKPSTAAVDKYIVPAASPKYISIPALDISRTRIIRLGLLKHGQIATPDNIYDAGWYKDSAEPGRPGAMFIYGHVSNWTAPGVFHNLTKLKQNDMITIINGEGTTYTYQVVETKVYDYKNVDMKAILSPVNPNKPGLNLMTCTGKIIKGTSQFNKRLVVFASLANS